MGNVTEISLRERIRLNLLSAMEQANINQVQLAERLGISKGTVNNWARGNNSPDVDMVPKICKVLGISILDLYSPTRLEPREGKQSAPLYSSEAQKLAADYDSLDGHGKKAVRAVADVEMVRCAEQAKAEPARELTEIIYTVPGYALPMSAGFGEPAGQEAPEDFSLKKAPPRGTSRGNSEWQDWCVFYGWPAVGQGTGRRHFDFSQPSISVPPHDRGCSLPRFGAGGV